MVDIRIFIDVCIIGIPIVFAITSHEAAHGYIAKKLGDDTAYRLGRVTFNPLKHIDLFGTVLLPGFLLLAKAPFLFGYAKPVPVDFRRLNNPKRDMIFVALAGPVTNIILALASGFLVYLAALIPSVDIRFLCMQAFAVSVRINCVLALFNMIPILPLDGGRVLTGLLPNKLAYLFSRTEPYGMFVVFSLLALPFLTYSLFGVSIAPLSWILFPIVEKVEGLIQYITGFNMGGIL